MRRNHASLFYRYLLSYIGLLLIPILIIGLLAYQHFVGILQEEVTISHRHVLDQASAAITAEFDHMNQIAIELSSRPELTPERLNQSMSKSLDAMETLRNMDPSPFVRQFVYYAKGSPYIYSPNTTYPVELFAESFLEYSNWHSQQFLQLLQDISSLNKPLFRGAELFDFNELADDRVLTYLVPVPYNSPSPYGVLLFFVEEYSVNKLLVGALKERNGNSAIVNQDGQIITALRYEDYLNSLKFKEAMQQAKENNMTIAKLVNNDTYVVSTAKLHHFNWTYVTMLPEEVFLNKANQVRTLFIVSIIIVLLIGGVFICLLMRLTYNPIQQLLAFISKQWGEAVRNVHEAREKISHLAEDRQLLRQKLDSNKDAARNHLLLKLLRGQVADLDACNAEGGDVGIVFTKTQFFVVLVESMPPTIGSKTNLISHDHLESIFRSYFECYRVDTADESKCIIICAVATDEQPSRHQLLLRLHHELGESYVGKVTIGVGDLYKEINQIGKSYIEAATALDYKLIKGHNKLITYGEIKAENESAAWYPREEMILLAQYIQLGDSAKVETILQKLQHYMEERTLPLHIARCICYDIYGCLIKTHNQLKLSGSGSCFPDPFALTKFDTMQDLTSLVHNICAQIKESMESISPEQEYADAWITYIQEYYHDQAFSVQRMADHFSVSRSYLLNSFKKITGQTITDYLDYYRLERAKLLLSDSDLRLKEIVESIGYHDVSSFIRKFKQQLNITPGDFRKLSVVRNDGAAL